jgi:hypothetical protein
MSVSRRGITGLVAVIALSGVGAAGAALTPYTSDGVNLVLSTNQGPNGLTWTVVFKEDVAKIRSRLGCC